MLIPCPWCGLRSQVEFTYGGDANVRRPAADAPEAAWIDYVYIRDNPCGPHGGALFDTSASRVAFAVSGARAATVLAKNCPIDLHASVFSAGSCAQTVLGHVNVLLYKPDATTTIIVMVARSFARDVWRALCTSSAQYGFDVMQPVRFGDEAVHRALG